MSSATSGGTTPPRPPRRTGGLPAPPFPPGRRLHAVLVERATPRLVELLAAALDGTGPAVAPLDAALPAAQLDDLLATLAPDTVEDPDGATTARSGEKRGVADNTAVIVGTSGSTGVPKGVELSAAALLYSARASLARIGARPGERWLCCLPATYIAGLQVLVRSLVSGKIGRASCRERV